MAKHNAGFFVGISDKESVLYAKAKIPHKPPKPCLNCGNRHKHNNSFCSADCCREWRSTHRAEGGRNVLIAETAIP